jgi:hypothetical protein
VKERLQRWWPALPAALILYFGGAAFVADYPAAPERRSENVYRAGGPDSLLTYARKAAHPDSAAQTASENPFRPIHAPHSEGPVPGSAVKIEPPPRHYVLKGTVGNDVATITNSAGQKMIVKAGDQIDSAEVISIGPNRVTLKDRAGKFDLQTEK